MDMNIAEHIHELLFKNCGWGWRVLPKALRTAEWEYDERVLSFHWAQYEMNELYILTENDSKQHCEQWTEKQNMGEKKIEKGAVMANVSWK